ncbi:T9SS type A sorting domain-containing protein [Pinibacter aurantiacus]|uniref:T9SS type A sorting domain-containing protein n=1 Tax=Pinibacter aurantiacus TaxID=2851599 RepID=A0A9E2W3A1_9BACT|nr:T9SS type A sorting domain-containing protein [Pinibacter aurantiacus]MBV4356584.1 T9SS type A sorting domain-containing protein [Pinibacter aurantiacus]
MKTCIFLLSMLVAGFSYDQALSAQGSNDHIAFSKNTTVNSPADSASLQLNDFLALYKKNSVILNWTAAKEESDDHFEIERSTDGVHFQKTGDVPSAGASDINVLYAYSDNVRAINTLKNDIYYRIKQVNKDGKSVYSKLLLVRVFGTKALKVMSITPNPVLNNIKVNVELNDDAMVNMKVIKTDGSEVIRKSVKGTTGQNTFEIAGTKDLPKGNYFLEVIVNSYERMTLQLIKE